MWPSWITYFLLGFSISAVPGAIFFETIRRVLGDKRSVYKFLLGNFSGMLLIVVCVWLGLALLIKNPVIENVFYLLCGLTLIYIGVSSMRQREKHTAKRLPYADYVTGLVLATLNPLSIIFWISLVGKISQEAPDSLAVIINVGSVAAGAAALFVLLIALVNIFKDRFAQKHVLVLSKVFGFIIVIYGFTTLAQIDLFS